MRNGEIVGHRPKLAEIQRSQPMRVVAQEVGMRLGEMFSIPQRLGLAQSMNILVGSEIGVGLLKKDKRLMEAREKWWGLRGNKEEQEHEIAMAEERILDIERLVLDLMNPEEAKTVKGKFDMIKRAANQVSAVYTDRVGDSLYSNPSQMGEGVIDAMLTALDGFVKSEEKYVKKII
jgi:hypothetical protein